MDDSLLAPEQPSAPIGSSLALLRLRHVFTQDELYSSSDFIREAEDRDIRVDLSDLQQLNERNLLVPFYRIDEFPDDSRKVELPQLRSGGGYSFTVLSAASRGEVLDPQSEKPRARRPHLRYLPLDPHGAWDDGYVYSSWQLLDLPSALNVLQWASTGADSRSSEDLAAKYRRRSLALAALSSRHLPQIWGQMPLPGGIDAFEFNQTRYSITEADLLALVDVDATLLPEYADRHLIDGHSDPMIEWWPLLRHADHKGWATLHGKPRQALWQRIAAEILLRAYEELAGTGAVEPLPDLGTTMAWTPQMDRITLKSTAAPPLEAALGQFGLSPHPRVTVVVEGQTELFHIPRLLDELGLNRPNRVRVVNAHGAGVNPQLLARYAITPRMDHKRGNTYVLASTPTALFIVMDPEKKWRDEPSRKNEETKLKNAVREEVEAQGATIRDDELDTLIQVRVWGAREFELANFSDEELAGGLAVLWEHQTGAEPDPEWGAKAATALRDCREKDLKFATVFGKLRLNEDKPKLAEILYPKLLEKFESEIANSAKTPVVEVVLDIRNMVLRLSGSGYILLGQEEPVAK